MKNNSIKNTQVMTELALLFSLAIVLMILENMIPPIPMLPPGIKLGLSNIVVMYCLFFIGKRCAFTILVLKSIFVFITRSLTAFLLSFSGGLCSIIILILLLSLKKKKISYIILSIFSAITHNLAQLVIAGFLLKNTSVFFYSPILIVSGVFMGIITGMVLNVMIPAMKRLNANQLQSKNTKKM